MKKIILYVAVITAVNSLKAQEIVPSVDQKSNQDQLTVLKNAVKARENLLVEQGWIRIYEDFQNKHCGVSLKVKPELSYTSIGVIGTNGNKDLIGQLLVTQDEKLSAGMKDKSSNGIILMENNDFQPDPATTKMTYYVEAEKSVTPSSGLVIFTREVDFKRDFNQLLDARNSGFEKLKSVRSNVNKQGFQIYFSSITLGNKDAKINETASAKEYILEMDMTKPRTARFFVNFDSILSELLKNGYKEYKNILSTGSEMTTYKKGNEEIMMLSKDVATNKAKLFIYKLK